MWWFNMPIMTETTRQILFDIKLDKKWRGTNAKTCYWKNLRLSRELTPIDKVATKVNYDYMNLRKNEEWSKSPKEKLF